MNSIANLIFFLVLIILCDECNALSVPTVSIEIHHGSWFHEAFFKTKFYKAMIIFYN